MPVSTLRIKCLSNHIAQRPTKSSKKLPIWPTFNIPRYFKSPAALHVVASWISLLYITCANTVITNGQSHAQ